VLPAFGLSVGGASGCRSFRAAHAHHAVHAMKIVLKGVLIQVHQAGGVDGSSHKPHAPGVVVSLNTPDVPLDRNEFEGFVPGGDSTVLHFDVEEVVRISPADQQSDTIVTVVDLGDLPRDVEKSLQNRWSR
jgi:hypothetical protein